MTELNEDDEIQIRINKAKAQMGLLRHFFDCNNINRKVKYWVYAAGPLNTLLCRAKSKTSELISPQSDKEDPWPKMGESQGKKIMNKEVR